MTETSRLLSVGKCGIGTGQRWTGLEGDVTAERGALTKQESVCRAVRADILCGTYGPGARLPLRKELQAHTGAGVAEREGGVKA